MTFDYRKRFQTSLLYLFIVVLYSTAIPTLAQESERFVLNEVKLVSDPTVGTTYTGDREIDPSTKLIQAEDWDPEKVPPLKNIQLISQNNHISCLS